MARYLLGLVRKAPEDFRFRVALIKGQPGIILYRNGVSSTILTLDMLDGRIWEIDLIANPDELQGVPALNQYRYVHNLARLVRPCKTLHSLWRTFIGLGTLHFSIKLLRWLLHNLPSVTADNLDFWVLSHPSAGKRGIKVLEPLESLTERWQLSILSLLP